MSLGSARSIRISLSPIDALEFSDGTIVPLACLVQGQWATVLQLPSMPMPKDETAEPANGVLDPADMIV